MATAKIKWTASDGTEWDTEGEAVKRDALDAMVKAIEALLPKLPREDHQRVHVDHATLVKAKTETVELCRILFPNIPVFKHAPMEIHPFSYAGRVISDVGGPINRIWYVFMCERDGWIYQQPYFAANPDKFKAGIF